MLTSGWAGLSMTPPSGDCQNSKRDNKALGRSPARNRLPAGWRPLRYQQSPTQQKTRGPKSWKENKQRQYLGSSLNGGM